MKKELTKFICIKNIFLWTIISILACIAVGKFIQNLMIEIATGANFFIPGITALFILILCILIFAVTRVIKYIRLIRNL